MRKRHRVTGLVLLFAVVAGVIGGAILMWTPPVEAKRCCWVMVCSENPPYACWEECRTCPKFP